MNSAGRTKLVDVYGEELHVIIAQPHIKAQPDFYQIQGSTSGHRKGKPATLGD